MLLALPFLLVAGGFLLLRDGIHYFGGLMCLVDQSYFVLYLHPYNFELFLEEEDVLHFGLHVLLLRDLLIIKVSFGLEDYVVEQLIDKSLVIFYFLFILLDLELL